MVQFQSRQAASDQLRYEREILLLAAVGKHRKAARLLHDAHRLAGIQIPDVKITDSAIFKHVPVKIPEHPAYLPGSYQIFHDMLLIDKSAVRPLQLLLLYVPAVFL